MNRNKCWRNALIFPAIWLQMERGKRCRKARTESFPTRFFALNLEPYRVWYDHFSPTSFSVHFDSRKVIWPLVSSIFFQVILIIEKSLRLRKITCCIDSLCSQCASFAAPTESGEQLSTTSSAVSCQSSAARAACSESSAGGGLCMTNVMNLVVLRPSRDVPS